MTTDRTSSTALAQRPAAASPAGRPQRDAPSEAFSALLGAAAPHAEGWRPHREEEPRAEGSRARREDATRAESGHREDASRPSATRGRDEHMRGAHDPRVRRDDASDAHGPRTHRDDTPGVPSLSTQPEEPTPAGEPRIAESRLVPAAASVVTEAPARLVAADLFAHTLAGPLAPAVAAVAEPTALPAEAAPTLPPFAPTQLSLAAQAPQVAAPAIAEAAQTAADGSAHAGPRNPTSGVPLPVLAGLTPASTTDAPAVELPATPPQAPAGAIAASEAGTTATSPATNASGGQPPAADARQPEPATAVPASQTKPADAPAASTPSAPAVNAAAATPTVPAFAPTGVERAVPLYRAPQTAATLIQIAAERGVTHARLHLKPVELGGIEVRLQTTPQGVTAQLVADSAEAARLLTQAADDLRRDLAARDVNLLSLDVSTRQDQRERQAGSAQADIFGDEHGPARTQAVRLGSTGDAAGPAAPDTTLVLPNGVLVDVLA